MVEERSLKKEDKLPSPLIGPLILFLRPECFVSLRDYTEAAKPRVTRLQRFFVYRSLESSFLWCPDGGGDLTEVLQRWIKGIIAGRGVVQDYTALYMRRAIIVWLTMTVGKWKRGSKE